MKITASAEGRGRKEAGRAETLHATLSIPFTRAPTKHLRAPLQAPFNILGVSRSRIFSRTLKHVQRHKRAIIASLRTVLDHR